MSNKPPSLNNVKVSHNEIITLRTT